MGSGILNSVHAFAVDPERGAFILLLLCLHIGGALTLFAWRAPQLREGGVFALWSRESGLLLNNVLLSMAAGIVFIGTLYPPALELVSGDKITVGAPVFNRTFLPVLGLTMLIAGQGPFLSWKRARRVAVLRRAGATLALVLALTAAIALAVGLTDPVGLLGIFVALWLAVATLQDIGFGAGLPGAGAAGALRQIAGLPRSARGLYLGHLGLVIAAAGVVAVSVWKDEAIRTFAPGEALSVGPYAFTLRDIENTSGPNYQTSIATVEVTRAGAAIAVLHPERRWYPVEGKPTTEAGIRSLWHGDLYAVLGDPDGQGSFVMRYYYNPGVPWMWAGGVLIALAGLVSLTDRRPRIGAPSRRAAAKLRPAE